MICSLRSFWSITYLMVTFYCVWVCVHSPSLHYYTQCMIYCLAYITLLQTLLHHWSLPLCISGGGSEVTHLQEDFQTVQRSSSCPGHGSCHRPGNQLPPHQTGPPLLLWELIWHRQMFPNVKHLWQHEKERYFFVGGVILKLLNCEIDVRRLLLASFPAPPTLYTTSLKATQAIFTIEVMDEHAGFQYKLFKHSCVLSLICPFLFCFVALHLSCSCS